VLSGEATNTIFIVFGLTDAVFEENLEKLHDLFSFL
jgi:hypothetical protein